MLEPEQHHLTSAESFYLLVDLLLLKTLFLEPLKFNISLLWGLGHPAKEQDFHSDDMRVWRRGEVETEACDGVTEYSREVPAPPTKPVGIIRTPGGPGKGKTHFPGKASTFPSPGSSPSLPEERQIGTDLVLCAMSRREGLKPSSSLAGSAQEGPPFSTKPMPSV